MLGIISIPAFIMLLGVLTIPYSPRWLSLKKREDDARKVLEKIRETDEDVNWEMNEIKESLEGGRKQSGWKMLNKGFFVRVLILGIMLMLLQLVLRYQCRYLLFR